MDIVLDFILENLFMFIMILFLAFFISILIKKRVLVLTFSIFTLISIPFIFIACGVLYYLSHWPLPVYFGFVGLISLIFLVQVLYNYKMWKKEEQS
ncbi:hypothetical protein [Priestia sp. GS2]|uniref:hypothetical protein n=1 Tax=Priestia sp. GS2 TaxID=3117403 RepID=UPI002ED78770